VPFPAGGVGDALARLLGKHLTSKLGQPVIVDNKPGASTAIGSEMVVRAKPDGHMLLLMSSSLTTLPATNPDALRFDPRASLTPISKLVQMPLIVAAGKNAPFRTIQEMLAYARANPGKLMVGVAPGFGGNAHLAFERLKLESKIDATAVPYKGSAPAVQALLSGEVPAIVDAIPGVVPHAKAGNVQLLAVMTANRLSGLPQIPTVSESGLPGYEADTWTGFAGPQSLPPDVVGTLSRELQEFLQLPDVKSHLIGLGMEPVGSTPAQFGATIEKNILDWKRVAVESKVDFKN
jgi:tripartite-type tricarboxylate transporter receptor subunit TctC